MGDINGLSREAIEALPAAIYMTDAEGRVTFYNEAAVELWGCRPELGESKFCGSWKLYWPDGTPLPHDECPMAMALHQRRPIRGMEAVAERPDGVRIPFIPYPTPLFDEAGELTGAVNMLVDISERKRTEADLADRKAQLAVFVEHAPAAIAMFDREMRYLAVSRRFVVDFRLPLDAQLIGRSHYEIFPDIPQRWRDVHARVLAGEELSQEEDQFTHQDGSTDWVRWSMVPWRRADGTIGGALLFSELRTDEVEARHALIDSEARFRATFENAAVGVALVGCDGSILRANNSFARMLGYSIEELKARTFQDLTHPDDLATNLSVFNKTLIGEAESYCIEKRYVRKDGGIVWASLTVGSVRTTECGVDCLVSVVQDITDRKRAETRLAERNAQLDIAGKIARIGTFMYDHGTKKSQLSPGCAAIYGLPEGTLEISREEWRALVHPDDLPRLDAIVRRALTNGEREFVLEFRIFRDDHVRWIESRTLISYNEAGKPVRRIGAQIDVTERKRAEQALAERNIQLALAAKAGLVGTYAYDADTEIMQISDGYAAIHGFPEGTTEIARSQCLAGVHPDDIGRVGQCRSEAFRERRREYKVEYRIIRSGGELRWVETRCFISYGGGGRPHRVVGVSIDITERKRVEEQQRTLLAELDHRVKNALATVSAVVSHTGQGSGSVGDFVAALDGRIRSMATTHELLSSHRWQGVSLGEVVRRELAPYATGDNTEVAGPGILLKPEAGQAMAMVLHELATNAAKYGALATKNGRVSIRWHRHLNGHQRSTLVFEWEEIGGPPVVALGKPSYGTSTIRDLIPYEFGGTVDFVLAPEGVRCRLELPADWLGNDGPPLQIHHGETQKPELRLHRSEQPSGKRASCGRPTLLRMLTTAFGCGFSDDVGRALDLGLVTRLSRPGWKNCRVVVGGKILVRSIDARLVTAHGRDASLEVVAHDGMCDPADRRERIDVRADPIRQRLAPATFRVRVVGGAQHGDEDVGLALLAGRRIDHRHRVAGEVDEQLFGWSVRLAHRCRDRPLPRTVEIAEPAVAIALGLLATILLPHQLQRHAAPLQLLVDAAPVRRRSCRRCAGLRREQAPLQLGVVDPIGDRPADAGHACATQAVGHCRASHADRLRDLAFAHPVGMLQSQDVRIFRIGALSAGIGSPRICCEGPVP